MSTVCYRGSIANTFTGFTNTTKQGLTEDDVRRIVREELARTPPHGWLHKDAEDEIKRLRAELAAAKREYREGGQSRPVREWENLFGSAPNATGSLSSEAFVRKQRDDDWP